MRVGVRNAKRPEGNFTVAITQMQHAYEHPHPEPYHVMWWYRRYIRGYKAKHHRSARGLIHLSALLQTYYAAKRQVIWNRQNVPGYAPEKDFPWKTPKVCLKPQQDPI
jgi:hypothetical protein